MSHFEIFLLFQNGVLAVLRQHTQDLMGQALAKEGAKV